MKSERFLCTEVPQYSIGLGFGNGFSPADLGVMKSPSADKSIGNGCYDTYGGVCMRMAASITDRRWFPGEILNIHFLGGTHAIHRKVLTHIQEWTNYANLKFTSDATRKSDIRVSFRGDAELGGGNWSRVGTDARTAAPDAPTMNLVINEYMTEANIRQVVLHEFGHAIGFIHEHSSPASNIKWDKEKVYAHYDRTSGWSRQLVNANVFEKYDGTRTQFSQFDPDSIMLYHIPEGLTEDGSSSKLNTELSATDQAYAAKWYPYPVGSNTVTASTSTAIPSQAGTGLHDAHVAFGRVSISAVPLATDERMPGGWVFD